MVRFRPLRALLCGALYGAALGAAHSDLYAARNLVKVPLLLITTSSLCALTAFLVARALGLRLSFTASQRAGWQMLDDLCALLASLAPAVGFIAITLRAHDDGQMGNYNLVLAGNVTVIAIAGCLAVGRAARRLADEHGASARQRVALLGTKLALALAVGGQVSFLLRPFVGIPATRGGSPPWCLWDEPDARGARNFYAAVLQTLHATNAPRWQQPPR